MELISQSKIQGAFEGFKKDRIFELFSGFKWRQISEREKSSDSHNPVVHIRMNNGRFFLEIAGMGAPVEVQRSA